MDHNGSRRYCNYSKEIDLQTETSNCSLRSLALKICLAEPELALLSFSPPHGGRSSTVEPRIVVPDVAGSNPVGHPFSPKVESSLRGGNVPPDNCRPPYTAVYSSIKTIKSWVSPKMRPSIEAWAASLCRKDLNRHRNKGVAYRTRHRTQDPD